MGTQNWVGDVLGNSMVFCRVLVTLCQKQMAMRSTPSKHRTDNSVQVMLKHFRPSNYVETIARILMATTAHASTRRPEGVDLCQRRRGAPGGFKCSLAKYPLQRTN